MRDFAILFLHLIVTLARLPRPGGLRSVVAESVLVRHQLLLLNRGRKRRPTLQARPRIIAGLSTLFLRPARILRYAIVLKPSTLLHFHTVLRKRKYSAWFSPQHRRRPGPNGPNKDLIDAIVALIRRNPCWSCPRLAQQISLALGVEIDKDVSTGCWAVIIGRNRIRDALPGSPFSPTPRTVCGAATYSALMDQFIRRSVGFGVQRGSLDRVALCRMFHRAMGGHSLPKYLSSDHDALYRFQQWQANLRVLEIREIKAVPYVPLSHPFVERLIGTIRREYLGRVLF